MEMNWLVLAIAVTAVAWIVIRRQLKKKEAAPPKGETPTEEVKEEETPVEEVKGEEAPVEETATEETPTQETPTQEVKEEEKKY